ncbi:tetratricopeptide repeat protein [Foetidibacter luteolus]|uniref:tetratricopeptide repeat protein n=1 Tax=Foetidibacter luteolus TaxID=2608880 RepID=UPI00129BD2AD|nr:tetratricopeptide repeat protein [Foetidibacter luteolus]
MNQHIKKAALLSVILLSTYVSRAQFTKANDDPDADFKLAKELFQKDQFSLAYPMFKMLDEKTKANSSIPVTIQLEARYYSLVCGLQLNDITAEDKAKEFIAIEHNTPRIQMLSYHLAEYYYRKQKFEQAIDYYEKTVEDNLGNREIANMKFHMGYAYFTMQRFNEAKPLFNAIRQIPSDPNYYDANYYYGFISFNEKNYKEAVSAFTVIDNQPAYQSVVPYYVAEIYYFNGERDKAIEYGEKALQKGGQYYDLKLRQLLGHAWFEKKEFAKAMPYLEKYVSNTEKVSREDLYELSYCYYEAKQWKNAIAGFKELGGKEDSLSQNSMYLLADAYLKTGQKPSARNAFLFCALNSSNLTQKEISKFNYGKLSYELGYQDVALNELQGFVTGYPKSEYIVEAKELLLSVLANTNNFKEALSLFESMGSQSETVRKVYPRVLYGRAVELVNDQQVAQADNLLNRLYAAPYNQAQLPYANFWKGEIAYRTNQLDSAIYYMENYLKSSVSLGDVNPANAKYILGYANLKQENYPKALSWFEQVTKTISAQSDNVQQDAYLRSADCYFMDKKFPKALQMYETVLNYNLPAADYALYQKAIISGASNRYAEKISLMQSLSQRYPASSLATDANMEIAGTYMANEEFQNAVAPLSNILKAKNSEAYKPQAYLKLGVVYYNLNNNNEALNNFKKLISGYPNSSESEEAVEYVRSIFIENQKPSEFIAFMRQNGKNVSYTEEDSITYVAANIAYENKNYDAAAGALGNYVKQYPDGRYVIDATYQMADIYNNRKDFRNAANYYQAVAQKAPNKYAEISALQAARISYFELKDYNTAETYFIRLKDLAVSPENKLEAMRGLLRCQYKLAKWSDAAPNAQDLLQQKGIAADDKMMANMVIAKSLQANNELDNAITTYRQVVALGKSEYSAEARYRIAEILLSQNSYADAEKAAFDVINKAGSYDYWITKSYILLGDIYFKQKDYFNAEATLKSVSENATDETLRKEAQQKLDVVIVEKNKNSKVASNQ